ncbi:zinc finger, CCHC-type containing protein, partial [Tanacetum coccineum]
AFYAINAHRLPLALLVYTLVRPTMTTSVVNNSIFRGFFEKQKLTRPNFIDWYQQLRIVLSVDDKLDYLESPIPPAPVPAQASRQVVLKALASHAAWVKGSIEIAGLMLMTMESDIQQNLENLGAYEMLHELKTLFDQQAEQLLQTVRDFHSCKQEEGQSVSSYVLKMKSYIDNLERLGHPASLNLGVSLILISLRKEFDSFVQNYNMHGMGKTVNKLHAMLKLHEHTLTKKDPALYTIRAGKVQKMNNKQKKPQLAARGQNQGKGKNKLTYALKPKIPSPPKRENPAKDSICCQCDDTGIFTIELYTFPNKSWVYDTGCGTHICNTTQGLRGSRKLKLGALSLYVGNGQRAAVEVIRSYHLCLPSGLVIVLNNFHYAPSITRGIILVSRLYDDGFVNRFVDNAISVSRNNMVYFSDVPRDGIFEIDLYNSNTNDSSMYVVSNKRAKLNLDSALSWHFRLGHISKKRIEKLQHDGLLNSTDLRAFEKSICCMSGKMARTPYTHQVERAKDLLGLIHTDVCGPFKITSRQGASYFVTFTDDFSRYVWGCEELVKQDTLTKPDKLETRSIKCIFIGYPKETMGYSFYYPPENKVLVARNAEFLKNSLITQEASGSLEDLEIIQEEDMHPSIDTSLNHEEGNLKIDEPQSGIIPIRRSIRTLNALNRMCLYIDAEEHKLGDLGEPANYKAALLDPESDKWLNVMNVEMQSMKDNEV